MATTTTTPTTPELPELPGPQHELPPRRGKPKKRGLVWVLFLLVIVGIAGYAVWRAGHPLPQQRNQGGGGFGGFGGGGKRGGIGPVPVVVQKTTRSVIPVYIPGLGNVTAFYTVTVKSRVDGQLMKVDFNEGDLVQKDQTILEIDPRPYQATLDLAQATQAHDMALLDNAKLDLSRYQKLVETDAIPKQQLDTQVALVAQYEATIKQDQATIDSAKLNLTYSKIPAPITGVVGLRLVDPGNIVHAADANGMIVITQLQPISVYFTIPEDNVPQVTQKLRAGAHLTAEAWNRDNSKKLATGELLTLDNQIDPTTGTSKLKAVFDNKDNALFPQQFVNIRLLVDTLPNQLTVPNVAVQDGQQGQFVYTVDNDSMVHLKTVQVGVTTETVSQILSGLNDGDRVVVDGTDRLEEGAQVRVRKPGELENPPDFDPSAFKGKGGGKGKKGFKKGDGNFKKGQGGGQGQ
ncbi:MAG TPA: MdtA/MuxA family multidrug efflux RND transporter periplasmic adaptor subunit [Bryobacteraceae bacterium]